MAASVRYMLGRAAEMSLNKTMVGMNHTANHFTQSEASKTPSATKAQIIEGLVFQNSKSVRTSTIILAAFNILAALATAISILYDCYWTSKRCAPKYKSTKFCLSKIHPAETFPLILALGIMVQGFVFAAVSGEGLQSLFISHCGLIAQFTWVALFIVPYLQVVFGLECALRSLRSLPFQARGKYDVAICLAVVVLMLVGTWLPSFFVHSNICFASLVWYVMRYGVLGLKLLIATGGLMILSAVIIFVRLSTVSLIDEHQRIAASRMVYYLILGLVSLAFVIPYFGSLVGAPGNLKLAMMATVVLNLSGLMTGLLQLFLRSNTVATSFGARQGREWDRKHHIRIFGPNELGMRSHLLDPVTGPRSQRALSNPATSRACLIGSEKGRIISMESLNTSPAITNNQFSPKEYEISDLPSRPDTIARFKCRGHARAPSYSLFPPEGSSPSKVQPTSVYDISHLAPPPALRFMDGPRHRRDSSIASSATVQIGLRISHAPSTCREDMNAMPLPSTTYKFSPKAPAPTLPSTSYATAPASLQSTTYANGPNPFLPGTARNPPPPSPLKIQINIPGTPQATTTIPLPAPGPPRPTPLSNAPTKSPSSPMQSHINKMLPPTPRNSLPKLDTAHPPQLVRQSTTQLTPAVYSPEKKIKTSGLVEVKGAPMSATLPNSGLAGRGDLASPMSPPKRSMSGKILSSQQQVKGEWI